MSKANITKAIHFIRDFAMIDVKPENVVTNESRRGYPSFLEFALPADVSIAETKERLSRKLGTEAFACPSQNGKRYGWTVELNKKYVFLVQKPKSLSIEFLNT